MKKNFFYSFCALVAILGFASCGDDDETGTSEDNYIEINGTKSDISKGYIYYDYDFDDDVYETEIYLVGSSISWNSEEQEFRGNGPWVWMTIYSKSKVLNSGTYNYDENLSDYWVDDENSMDCPEMSLSGNPEYDDGYIGFISGTLDVSSKGKLSFSFVTESGKIYSGSYDGKLSELD